MNPGQAAAEVAAKRFSLVGDDGKELAAMELTSDGLPSVTLRDESGHQGTVCGGFERAGERLDVR